MRNFVPCLRSQLLVRVAAIALISGATAACSSDSTRFGESPFSNPFSSASSAPAAPERAPDTTSSIQAAPTSRVERSPLGAPSAAQSKPMYGYGGNGGSGGSDRSSRVEPRSTGSLSPARGAISRPAPSPVIASSGSSNWSAQGGSTVTLGRGESVHTLSQRYGVPASAILQANGLSNANGVGEGRQLVIPVYSAGGSARVAVAAPLRPAAPAVQPAAVRPAPIKPQIAVAAPVAPKAKMQLVPGAQSKALEPIKPATPAKTAAAPVLKPSVSAPAQPVVAQAPKPAATPAPKAQDAEVKTAALKVEQAPAAEPAGPSFRWPARGRVISGYGSKTSGSSNDGVNIAVPEGTEVKASDDGVVAYSGSELKGFGNLVLIRHSNGWVTAYAHNSANSVKRGDAVRRGQIIAKSGATGSVSTPQLHFEVRKGASTVDPLKHLPDV